MVSLLTPLTKAHPSEQAISNTVYGLSLMLQSHPLIFSPALTTVISDLVRSYCAFNIAPIWAQKILRTLTHFGSQIQCQKEIIHLFGRAMAPNFLHPQSIAHLIADFVAFRSYQPALQAHFETLLSAIQLELKAFPPALRTIIEDSLSALEKDHPWKHPLMLRLGLIQEAPKLQSHPHAPTFSTLVRDPRLQPQSSIPRTLPTRAPATTISQKTPITAAAHCASWPIAYHNAVFKAIADRNIKEFKRLLGLSEAQIQSYTTGGAGAPHAGTSGSHTPHSYHARAPRQQPDLMIDHRATASALALRFFSDTPAEALRELISTSPQTYFQLLLQACSHHTRYQLAREHQLHNLIMYIAAAELQSLIQSLISLEFYRDHKALLSLVDALTIRMLMPAHQMNGTQALMIALRIQLLDRAIQFHTDTHHVHVMPRIQAIKAQLVCSSTFLEDDSDEELPQVLQIPSIHTTHSRPASTPQSRISMGTFGTTPPTPHVGSGHPELSAPRPAIQQALRLQESRPTSKHQLEEPPTEKRTKRPHQSATVFAAQHISAQAARPGLVVNTHYQYADSDIQRILDLRIQDIPNVVLLTAAHMNHGAHGNRVADVLEQYLGQPERQSNWRPEKKYIIPIGVGAHWVGIVLHIREDADPVITFYDSLWNEEARGPDFVEQILAEAQEFCASLGFDPHTLKYQCHVDCLQQADSTSCGPFLIENIYCDLEHKSWEPHHPSKTLEERIRERHLKLLYDKDRAYHARFIQDQAPLSASRSTHQYARG